MTAAAPHPAAVKPGAQVATTEVAVVAEADQWRLPNLSNDITECIYKAQAHAAHAVAEARRAGELLLEAKALVAHGQWEYWLSENCGCAVRTAQAYMRLATKLQALPADEAQCVALLPLREALKAISTPSEAPPRPPAYKPEPTDRNKVRPTFEAASRSLRSITRDVGYHKLSSDRIKKLRERLQAVMAELDRMEGGAQ